MSDGKKFGISTAVYVCLIALWNGICFGLTQYTKRNPPKDGPPPLDFMNF